MHPVDIKILLLQRGTTQRAIARRLGISPAVVSQVVSGARRTPLVRRAIAEELRISYRSLWGEDDPGVDRLPAGRPKSVTSIAHFSRAQGE